MKVNSYIQKGMEKNKIIIMILVDFNLKENIYMKESVEKEKNIKFLWFALTIIIFFYNLQFNINKDIIILI